MAWQRWQWFLFFGLITVDQLTKWWASQQGLVSHNSGVSFGLFHQLPGFLLTALLVVVAAVAAWWWHQTWPEAKLASTFFWAGAVGNLVDRVLVGAVRDFLPLPLTTTQNNLADWYITVGLVLLVWQLVRSSRNTPSN